jgi:hypothetical protein
MAAPDLHRSDADSLAALERESVADQLLAQRELIALETLLVDRLLTGSPGIVPVTFGPGQPAEQTLDGDPRDPFLGLAVFNRGPYPLAVGYSAQGALSAIAPLVVPAFSWAVTPIRYTTVSIAAMFPGTAGPGVAPDASQATFAASVIRLRVPPLGAMAGALPAPPAKGWAIGPGAAIGAAQTLTGDVVVAGYTRLTLLYQLVTATTTDLSQSLFPYDVDGTLGGRGMATLAGSQGAAIGAGSARAISLYDVTGYDRVRVQLTNAGAGATTGGVSYFLR